MTSLQGHFELQQGQFTLDVSFQLPNTGVTALFGASGSGKTTLLRCIAGLERAPVGYLSLNGHCWQDEQRRFFMPTHQRPLGYVFQEASLFPHLSVKRNLEYGQRRIPATQRKVALAEAVELLGIAPLFNRRTQRLSGGERQRVAIARALLTSPQLLLMDEPLSALDATSKADILPYLERLHTELAIPVLYITHAFSEVMHLADHILLLQQGQLLASGRLLEVLTRLDLPMNQTAEAGVIVEAKVMEHDARYNLTYLAFAGGRLSVPREPVAVGHQVRVSLLAKDISLSLTMLKESSILNSFAAKIVAMQQEAHGQMLVKLNLNGAVLLARVSLKSAVRLQLKTEMQVYANIKSVGIV